MASPSLTTSPILSPIRNRICTFGAGSMGRAAIAFWIVIAHCTASMTLLNSMRNPSPMLRTVRPR